MNDSRPSICFLEPRRQSLTEGIEAIPLVEFLPAMASAREALAITRGGGGGEAAERYRAAGRAT